MLDMEDWKIFFKNIMINNYLNKSGIIGKAYS